MFTGLIERMGTVGRVESRGKGKRLAIAEPGMAADATIGQSIAINGACLTVAAHSGDTMQFDAGPETLAKTTLGTLKPGSRVNLERALQVGARLGGHFVQGHVDGVGHIHQRTGGADWDLVWIKTPAELTRLMVPKGSVAVDGVSLTVVDVEPTRFSVALIPHTLANTTLGALRVGQAVNIETDILGKYVLRLLEPDPKGTPPGAIGMDALRRAGFAEP